MARTRPTPQPPAVPPIPPVGQLDLFPESAVIERLNPRQIAGQRTAVVEIIRVRIRSTEPAHLVFHDRHGWYCETHGPACVAVAYAHEFVNGKE